MTKNSNKEKRVTVRLTNSRHSELMTYAKAHEMSLSQAIETLITAGLKSEQVHVATKEDIQLLASDIKQQTSEQTNNFLLLQRAIENQPLITQQLSSAKDVTKKSWWKRFLRN